MSSSVTEIDADNKVKVVRTPKRSSAGRRSAKLAEKDPLALPKRKTKAVPTKAARKQSAQPEEYEVSRPVSLIISISILKRSKRRVFYFNFPANNKTNAHQILSLLSKNAPS